MGSAPARSAVIAIGRAPTITTAIASTPSPMRVRDRVVTTAHQGSGRPSNVSASAPCTASTGTRTQARYPLTTTSSVGIMEFGSVPVPPNTPRSWTTSHVAKDSVPRARTPPKTNGRRPLTRAAPDPASTITTTRLTSEALARLEASERGNGGRD